MNEINEMWREHKKICSAKKIDNKLKSTAILIDNGIKFKSNNGGIHLVINRNNLTVDFWPSTGKFNVRGHGYGRGIKNLLKLIGGDND